MSISDDISSDVQLVQAEFESLALEIRQILGRWGKPRTAKSLVETASDLKMIANRYDALTRTVLEIQGKACTL